jgi:hypothetical protein
MYERIVDSAMLDNIGWRVSQISELMFENLPVKIQRYLLKTFLYNDNIKLYKNSEHVLTDVYIELRTRCNQVCPFCIASKGNDPRPDEIMSFELYEKLINNLVDMSFKGQIHYYQTNDPLIVPNLERYIQYSKKNLPDSSHFVLTNGKALGIKNGRALLDAGTTVLSINVYSDEEKLIIPNNVQKFLDEVLFKKYPPETAIIPIENSNNSFIFKTKDFSLYIRHRVLTTELSRRVGTAPNRKALSAQNNFLGFCAQPFFQLSVTTDGRVGRCCNDALILTPMGNVNTQSLSEIWDGKLFKDLRIMLLKIGRKDDPFCQGCDSSGFHAWNANRKKGVLANFFKNMIDKI